MGEGEGEGGGRGECEGEMAESAGRRLRRSRRVGAEGVLGSLGARWCSVGLLGRVKDGVGANHAHLRHWK